MRMIRGGSFVAEPSPPTSPIAPPLELDARRHVTWDSSGGALSCRIVLSEEPGTAEDDPDKGLVTP